MNSTQEDVKLVFDNVCKRYEISPLAITIPRSAVLFMIEVAIRYGQDKATDPRNISLN